ncbi:MAG: hypothetical protein Q8859_07820 [Bacteroidota bacterium]|nr:hypothetical protein [Bacteroidota bacterium]
MKKLIFLFLGIIFLSTANAQGQETTFSVTFGSAIPVGSFASKSINESAAGMAKNGLFMDLNFTYTPENIFGLTGSLFFSDMGNNDLATSSRLEKMMGVLYHPLTSIDNQNTTINQWRWGSLLVGPSIKLPVGKGTFDLKAFTGLQYTYLPYQEIWVTDSSNQRFYHIRTHNQNKVALPYRLSTSLSYPVSPNVRIKLQADYYKASINHTLDELIFNTATLQNVHSSSETFKVPIQTINIGIGLVYTL